MSTPVTGVEMTAQATGLSVQLVHGPSSKQLTTDPPRDNGGTGASFSPTDLVGAALASCALTTMALAAKREGVAWGDAQARVEKRMVPNPRRIGELVLDIRMPAELPPEHRARFEEIARTCPVAKSLDPALKIPLTFSYPK
jgi:uncharacterized OsmC-like protein